MRKVKRLSALKIDEVSSVRRGAGEGVKVVLMKRHDFDKYSPDQARVPAGGPGGGEWVGSNSRGTQPAPQKDQYFCGKTGSPHGCGYPGNCIFGRCQQLQQGGHPRDQITQPLTPWKGNAHAQQFTSAQDKLMSDIQSRDYRTGMENHPEYADSYADIGTPEGYWSRKAFEQESEMNLEVITKANAALHESVLSILADDKIADKEPIINKTFTQYQAYLAANGAASTVAKGDAMSDDVKKQIADLTAANKKLTTDLAIAKMSKEEQDHANGLDETEKAAFAAKSPDDRAKCMAAKKAAPLPDDVKKALDEAADIKKRLEIVEEREAVAKYAKEAVDLGLPESAGETLRKADKGDKEALADVRKMLKGLTEQVRTGKVFAEFGNSNPAPASAYAALQAKGEELRKAEPTLTKEQAFTKAYGDPANRELVEQSKRERAA